MIPNQRDPDEIELIRALRDRVTTVEQIFTGRWGHYVESKAADRPTPSAAVAGVTHYATDTFTVSFCDGTGWIIMREPPQSYVSTISSLTGSITTVGSHPFIYTRNDGWLHFETDITITTNGTGATNITCTLPVAPAISGVSIGCGRENAVTGNALTAITTGGVMWIQKYDNTYPAFSGALLGVVGKYRMTTPYS